MQTPLTIALYGLGAAGKARQQACAELPYINVRHVISRHQGLGSWKDALQDPLVTAVAIAIENTGHATAIREALKAGKHVLCDYPIAFSYNAAQELLNLAAAHDLRLHIEHIGLLTSAHQDLKELLRAHRPCHGRYEFQGNWHEHLANTETWGPPELLSFSRILQLFDILGPGHIATHTCQSDITQHRQEITLTWEDGTEIVFQERRQAGLKRQRRFVGTSIQGPITWEPQARREQLFRRDLKNFYQQIFQHGTHYYDQNLLLHLLKEMEPYR